MPPIPQTLWSKPFDPVTGGLRIVPWADQVFGDSILNTTTMVVNQGELPVEMAHSPATGMPLVSNGQLGVDVIRLRAGDGFQPHTHPGDHLLMVIGGVGTITYDGFIYRTQAGQVYLIDGEAPHAVGAITDHVILAVGSPHKGVGDPDRMQVSEYAEVLAGANNLTCLICQQTSAFPAMLHDLGCDHCPCATCNPIPEGR
jgi:quercetin dioxygenase-like cupin family protein